MKAIIFDLDGVICTTDKYHYLAWKKISQELGVYFDEKINNRLRGVSRMDCLDIILTNSKKKICNEEKERIANRKNEIYLEYLKNMNPKDLSEEVKLTLDVIRKKGLRVAIGSSSKNAKYILSRLELTKYFDAISDGTNIIHSKPDPEVFLKAAEDLDIIPELCLVVEDSIAGVDAAFNGGFKCAGLGEAARYSKVTYPLKTFKDILKITF